MGGTGSNGTSDGFSIVKGIILRLWFVVALRFSVSDQFGGVLPERQRRALTRQIAMSRQTKYGRSYCARSIPKIGWTPRVPNGVFFAQSYAVRRPFQFI